MPKKIFKVAEGQVAPQFSLPDANGKKHALKDYRGQWVLVYFYPKDDTPGCTKEACMLRDNFPQFGKVKAVVLGISKDTPASHKKFAAKYDLPFTLLADEDKKVAAVYGAWGDKSMYGRIFKGMRRVSVLIDPKGKIAKLYDKVKPSEHAEEVLADLKSLSAK